MKHDRVLLAMLLSILSFVLLEILTRIGKGFHLTSISGLEAMSMGWIPEGSLVLGILAGFGIACWNGILIYYSSLVWGTDYFPLKAMILAMTGKALFFSVFGVLGKNQQLIQDVSGNYVHAFATACAGLLLGYLYKKYLFVSQERTEY